MADRFTAGEKLAAVQRELAYRRRVYPRRVALGKMSKPLAELQIRLMAAIEADYIELEKTERLI